MNSCFEGASLLMIWIGFLLLMIACIAAVFVWAIRTRQFTNQERARYLALESLPPESGQGGAGRAEP